MPSIELRTRQSLALTPRLQQSVRLLQLSSLEFQQELRTALDTNPFLEYDSSETEDVALAGATPDEDGAGVLPVADTVAAVEPDPLPAESAVSETLESAGQDEMPGDFSGDYNTRGSTRQNGDSDGSDPAEWARSQPTLREQLHDALRLYRLDDRDRAVARFVIEALDDDGYLRQDLADLADSVDLEPELTEEELLVALRLVQSLDRPGLGARSLSECLLLQVNALPADTPGRDVARQIVEHHLERLARREQAELQKQIGCSADELRVACALVRKLDPKPGNCYGRTEDNYVVPDVIVRQVRNKWVVTINPAVQPRARIHRMYAELFAQSAGASRSPLAQQLQEARWLIRNAQQRFDTIQRVAECIVAHQKAFFQYGEIALKPMVLRDVADELGLHESTISRATGNKYMATPRGIFEFKHFFPRELGTESGGTCSAAAVRALLKEMIAAENTRDPLSDVTLARMLADQGVLVARRTVAKYRHLMKVPPAELRRQI
ncbi:RNA polymerase factor sigma-54 [Paraburkholderia sp. 22099]|jgi:RNA polymerase sigma-54 factor|uniref:RNA polymerase sigma-54 factor n=1 Tax=Paraburkholderia terricola TaxID=169427 RepID=A0A1M6RD58_9BURK|nr:MULTISPECIES: RNA polymerase factor sigma-54 [Paraburkholderia]ORC45392.1 RNA polymerase factor sigma-54 [Burkholderia sp. A27]AXE96397.1 RNA polymerase factor sigma-54 [Paraburkholderia terricola]MDR6409341.1 RNA polymerase sigma-54 factor [Paraburkholderia terricola]MDR6449780.1 RNA polymerase sigma-54 factor [Paraburkholderia terricola]MDR6482396.1 RNA polymerase sigma-54 factor [Paraburkholderia terricola]